MEKFGYITEILLFFMSAGILCLIYLIHTFLAEISKYVQESHELQMENISISRDLIVAILANKEKERIGDTGPEVADTGRGLQGLSEPGRADIEREAKRKGRLGGLPR